MGTGISPFTVVTQVDTFGTAAIGAAGSAQITGVAGLYAFLVGWEVTFGADGTGAVTDTLTVAQTASGFNSLVYKLTSTASQGSLWQVTYQNPIPCLTMGGNLSVALGGVANRASADIVVHGYLARP